MKKFTSMLAAALLVFSVAGTNLADAAEPNTIAVCGMAEQEVAPDMAYVDLGITVRDLDKLSQVIDNTVKAGVTNIDSVSYALSTQNIVQRQLLAAAVENAREKAAVVASAGSRTLGSMLSADINGFTGGTVVAAGSNKLRSASVMADGAEATELAPGKIKLNARVQVVFALN